MANQSLSSETESPQPGWRIGPRNLPMPAGASDFMRDSIAQAPQPDPASIQVIPQSVAEWLAIISEADEEDAGSARDLSEQLAVTIVQDTIAGVDVHHLTPAEIDPWHADHLFVHVHGGAFVMGAGVAGLHEAILISCRDKIPVLSIDYRMPPRYPAPIGRDDLVAVYCYLLQERSARSIALGGSSGGGTLIMEMVQRLTEREIAVPGALYLGSPGADMSKTGDSYFLNEGVDRVTVTYDGFIEAAVRLYANGRDLKDPMVSPLYGDFHGFPPTFLVTGTRDLLLSATARTHIKLREAGAVAEILVYEGMSHVEYYLEIDSPESLHTYAELNAFLLKHLCANESSLTS